LECPICGNHEFRALTAFQRAHLVRCQRCRQVFAGRRPSDEELVDNYRQYPRTDFDSAITRRRYRELLHGFERYRRTNRILDFGCGLGFFLEEARRVGWDAYGSEYEPRAVEINRSKGLTCVQAPIGPEDFSPGWFDAITAFEVVEHLRDPREEAALIATLLRPGGVFYCTTPNFGSLSRRALRSRWAVIEYPEHLLYFAPGTLSGWLQRFGFRPIQLTTSGFTMSRRHDQATAPADVNGGAPDQERLRAKLESSPVLRIAKASANSLLGMIGAGDTIKGHFELAETGSPALAAEEHLEREQSP
jgi:2-polyprenyl-3-methyl-5-hydroxy-6-metoxy-1,4-benzoquinol methylase